MNKNIVILSGSPRRNGNSEKLVAAFKEGAESAGKTVTVFRTAHMKIKGCSGCEYCHESGGKCSIKDDMTEVLDAIGKANAVVFVSPIYYFSFSAQLKTAIDRMYPLRDVKGKQAALLLTCAEETIDTATGALTIYQRIVKYYEWEDVGIVIATDVEHIGDIDGCEELEEARKLGRTI